MANLQGLYDKNDEPSTSFEPIPNGRYVASITKSELKPTASKNGEYLELTFTIQDGDYKNRTLFARLNLVNPSAQAVAIARKDLAAIRHATGVLDVKDSQQLHNIPIEIDVIVEPRNDKPEFKTNRIKSYNKRGSKPVAQQGQAAAAADGPQPTYAVKGDNGEGW